MANPLTCLWSQLIDQGLTQRQDAKIGVWEVINTIQITLVLLGNANNFISETRREWALEAIHPTLKKYGKGDFSSGKVRLILNLKSLNGFLEYEHFKMDDNIRNIKDLLRRNEFMCKLDLKDAYLTVPIHPSFSMARQGVRIYSSSVRPSNSAPLVHEAFKAGFGKIEVSRSEADWISRRFPDHWQNEAGGGSSLPEDEVSSREPWIHSQHRKVLINSDSADRIFGLCHQLRGDGHRFASTESEEHQGRVSPLAPGQGNNCAQACQGDWHVSSHGLHRHHSYESVVTLNHQSTLNLTWWMNHLTGKNGRPIIQSLQTMVIQSGASNSG